MINREQIINSMCMTLHHDYGLVVSEFDKLEMPLMSGMTESERKALWNNMAQIFDNDIAPLLEDYRKVNEGEYITMPKSEEHAKAMLRVAQFYLDNQG